MMIADRQGVEIDFCPECRGVWLDRGELDKLIRQSASPMAGGAAARSRRHDGADRSYHHERRRRPDAVSFLTDIFDL